MEYEYSIKVLLSEHRHDNPDAPYYWSLIKYDTDWKTVEMGWASSPTQCFLEAYHCYQERYLKL